jgi:hypothetical protein
MSVTTSVLKNLNKTITHRNNLTPKSKFFSAHVVSIGGDAVVVELRVFSHGYYIIPSNCAAIEIHINPIPPWELQSE